MQVSPTPTPTPHTHVHLHVDMAHLLPSSSSSFIPANRQTLCHAPLHWPGIKAWMKKRVRSKAPYLIASLFLHLPPADTPPRWSRWTHPVSISSACARLANPQRVVMPAALVLAARHPAAAAPRIIKWRPIISMTMCKPLAGGQGRARCVASVATR